MTSPTGQIVGASPQGMATTLKGQTWGLEIDGVMYDAEFTGAVSGNGVLLMMVKGKSRTSQQPSIKAPKE